MDEGDHILLHLEYYFPHNFPRSDVDGRRSISIGDSIKLWRDGWWFLKQIKLHLE